MSLPALTAQQVARALSRADFYEARMSGSHKVMKSVERGATVTVPMHKGSLPTGTLRNIIRQAKMTVDEFLSFL